MGNSSDDAEEILATGAVSVSSADLELGQPAQGFQLIGIRFAGAVIPEGATITDAYIEFTADEDSSQTAIFEISGEKSVDAMPFNPSQGNISSRPSTFSSVPWGVSTPWSMGRDYRTENIRSIIQEIIDQEAWVSGNSIAVALSGIGTRSVASYDYTNPVNSGPRLIIIFDPTSGPIPVPTSTLVPTSTEIPTEEPTVAPTEVPTEEPTVAPTEEATEAPTTAPTAISTEAPISVPTTAPTTVPTVASTETPIEIPTTAPTTVPTTAPTVASTEAPIEIPTSAPTEESTIAATNTPIEAATPNSTPAATSTPEALLPTLTVELVDNLLVDADNDGIPSPGDTIGYSVLIINSGETAATGVRYSSQIDENMTLLGIDLMQGDVLSGFEDGATELVLALDDIPGGNGQIEFSYSSVLDNPLSAAVTEIIHVGVVSTNELPDRTSDDPDIGGSFDATLISINANSLLRVSMNDLLLVDADQDAAVSSGDVLLFTIEIVNIGNVEANNVLVTTEIDPNTTLVPNSVNTMQGTILSGNLENESIISVNLDSLAGGGERTRISFQVFVNDNLETQQIVHQAVISNMGSGNLEGAATIFSDDPDTEETSDSTITLLLTEKNTNFAHQIYVPLINQ